jgi:hypothetical protein
VLRQVYLLTTAPPLPARPNDRFQHTRILANIATALSSPTSKPLAVFHSSEEEFYAVLLAQRPRADFICRVLVGDDYTRDSVPVAARPFVQLLQVSELRRETPVGFAVHGSLLVSNPELEVTHLHGMLLLGFSSNLARMVVLESSRDSRRPPPMAGRWHNAVARNLSEHGPYVIFRSFVEAIHPLSVIRLAQILPFGTYACARMLLAELETGITSRLLRWSPPVCSLPSCAAAAPGSCSNGLAVVLFIKGNWQAIQLEPFQCSLRHAVETPASSSFPASCKLM